MLGHVWEFASGHDIEAGRLRRQIMSCVRRYAALESDFGAAEMICGELIANAVRHAPGRVSVSLDWERGSPTITVADDGPAFPIAKALPVDALAETGRGLYIVRALARKVQLDSVPSNGTRIMVELPVFDRGFPVSQ